MTLQEMVQEMLCKGGIQEAAAIEVKFKTGETVTIHSGDHPALQRPAEEVVSATPKQSASGG